MFKPNYKVSRITLPGHKPHYTVRTQRSVHTIVQIRKGVWYAVNNEYPTLRDAIFGVL